MSGDTQTAVVTTDSVAAAFLHFNITDVTASEFFRFITKGGGPLAATTSGAVIPVCMYALTSSTN